MVKVARVNGRSVPIIDSVFGVGGSTSPPYLDDLLNVDLTGLSDGDTIVFDDATDTWLPGAGGASSLPWFVVTEYGATGDGTTDDRTAINAAIAAYNAAGGGVLYFPATADSYYVSDALTALTVPGLVLGDGRGNLSSAASPIETDHATAKLFTVSANFVEFRGLGLINTATTPASGGAGIATTTGAGSVCTYRDLWIEGFYDCLSIQYGSRWLADGLQIINPSRYGIWIANVDVPDGGDWTLSNSEITTDSTSTHTPTSAIRQDSSGGGKVTNVKINGDSAHEFVTGYDLVINGSANNTSVLTIASCSMENVSGDAVSIASVGTGRFALIAISALQVGLYSNNAGYVVKVVAATNGDYGTNGAVGLVTLDGIAAYTDGTARAAVSLTNTDRVTLGDMALQGFDARYTSSGDTNTIDGGGSSSGRWELAVIPGSPPDSLYAGGDWLYIFVP